MYQLAPGGGETMIGRLPGRERETVYYIRISYVVVEFKWD